MARITKESLEAKIQKAEERVIKTGKTYNAACDELKALRDKKAAIENEELVQAFMKSNKTLEEAIAFFESDMKKQTTVKTTSRRGRKKKTT